MKLATTAALILLATAPIAIVQAADTDTDKSLSGGAMDAHPGTKGGTTATPAAKPMDGSLQDKAMKDQPGTKGGSTSMPNAEPKDGSLAEKAMEDQPGAKK